MQVMATKGTVWCHLQLLTFTNVGLFYHGFYRFNIALRYCSSSGQEMKATPIYCKQFRDYLDSQETMVGEGKIDRDSGEYESATIMIGEEMQEARINDLCCFETIVDCVQGLQSKPLTLTISLKHNYARDHSYPTAEDPPTPPVATVTIANPLQGVHEYRQVTFRDQYFSTLGVMVHTTAVQWEVEGLGRELPEDGSLRERELRADFDGWIAPIVGNLRELQGTVADIQPHVSDFTTIVSLTQAIYPTGTLPQDQLLTSYWNDFLARCRSATSSEATDVLRGMVTYATYYVTELMTALLSLSSLHTSTVQIYYQEKAQTYRALLYDFAVHTDTATIDSLPLMSPADQGNRHKTLAAGRRLDRLPVPVSPISQLDLPDMEIATVPVLFVDSYKSASPAEDRQEPLGGFHLMIFVNGYGGSRGDLLMAKDFIARKFSQNADFLLSQANQRDDTKEDIFEMGRKLAVEIETYLGSDADKVDRLSFIGYSMGGVIIRAALCYLEKFKGKMFTFLTLSSPHLGLMYASSVVMEAGLWLWKSYTQAPSLKQLSMSDASVIKGTALYQLSQHSGLEWFQHVVLFSSYDDYYSPIESSRIELSEKAVNGSEKGCYFVEMVGSLLANIKPERLLRVNVDFVLPASLDHLVGRKAHLEFLTNPLFLMILTEKFPQLFV